MAQAHVLSKEQADKHGCAFEEYNLAEKKMKPCGRSSVARIGVNHLCISHIVDGLAFSKTLDMYGIAANGAKFGKRIDFKEDFLKLCKIEEESRSVK